MPLSFDMPWEELQNYKGINPKPEDFDAFWAKSLEEMYAIDPQVSLVPAPFQTSFAECFDMFFTGVGGARIHAQLLQPHKKKKPHPALLMFHGYSMNAGSWYDKLAYAAAGFTVAALDCRGQGGSSEDVGGVQGTTYTGHIVRGLDGPAEQMLFRHIFLDSAQIAHIVMTMPEVDAKRVAASGSSQGGALSLICASLVPEIKQLAPIYPFLCDYKRVWEIDLALDAYHELQHYFRRFDPQHQREDEIFTKLGYIDVQHFVSRIQGRVLMGIGLMDRICPPSTQFAAYNKITAEKQLCRYPDYSHETLPGHADTVFRFMQEL